MIVVVGSPVFVTGSLAPTAAAAGLPAAVAFAAAATGAKVQLVGKVGDDPPGDAVMFALTAAAVGHAALLRDASHATPATTALPPLDGNALEMVDDLPMPAGLPLDPADIELALRYLTDFRVLVLADPIDAASRAIALDAAGFTGAHVIDLHGRGSPADAPERSFQITAFEAPTSEAEAFGQVIGRYAAGLDAGRPAADAFRDATRAGSWEPAAG